jgi:hypothetical protein
MFFTRFLLFGMGITIIMKFVVHYPQKEIDVKKYLLLVVSALLLVFAAGCVDLFAVPGVAVSPDGSQIYFLGGDFNAMSSGSESETGITLSSANVSDGNSKVLIAGGENTLITAFAVNPSNGEVAYMSTLTADAGDVGIYIYGTDGSSRQLVTKDALGGLVVGTMMTYSRDGSKIALSGLLFPPEITPDMLEGDSNSLTPEQLAQIKNIAWVINAGDGSIKTVSNPDTERANTVAWNPTGNLIAYNAWVDSNGDGTVSSSGASGIPGMSAAMPGGVDLSEIHIYDVNSGSVTTVQSSGLSFAPVFFNDNTVAYVTGASESMMGGGDGFAIATADVGSGASTSFYSTSTLIAGLGVSPDGSQVAWAEVDSSSASSGSGDMPPAKIFVSPTGAAAAAQVAEVPGSFLVDSPVWSPDGTGVYISSTNILSSMIGGMSSMMGSIPTEDGATVADTLPGQQVTWVNVASGETHVVYTGGMMNSGMFASLMSLAGMEGMEDMMGAGS